MGRTTDKGDKFPASHWGPPAQGSPRNNNTSHRQQEAITYVRQGQTRPFGDRESTLNLLRISLKKSQGEARRKSAQIASTTEIDY
jgi:hypothetical protein